jgi:DNA-binding MarR family transcriptional regulator
MASADSNQALVLNDFWPYRIVTLANRISRAIAEHYEAKFSLSVPEWRIMAVLGEGVEMSAGEVAEKTAMDKVAVSRAVKQLLKARRIDRRVSPEDRRRSILRLSATGADIYRQIVPLALSYERALLSELSAREIASLDTIFYKLDSFTVD